MSQLTRLGSQTRAGLTRVHGAVLVLDDGHGGQAAHHRHPDQLQADVQPLHGRPAQELAALVELQEPGGLLLKPGPEGDHNPGRIRAAASKQPSKHV